jgi:hypothetical protein
MIRFSRYRVKSNTLYSQITTGKGHEKNSIFNTPVFFSQRLRY